MHQRSGYALMVNSGERIEKFLVCRLENGDFELGGRTFATVPDIIDRFELLDSFLLNFTWVYSFSFIVL